MNTILLIGSGVVFVTTPIVFNWAIKRESDKFRKEFGLGKYARRP